MTNAQIYMAGATFSFLGGIALLIGESPDGGMALASFVLSGFLVALANKEPEQPRREE